MLVIQIDYEVVLAFECHDLLGAHLRSSGKDHRGDTARSGQGTGGSCEVGGLDVVDADVSHFDILGLKLATEGGSMEGRA